MQARTIGLLAIAIALTSCIGDAPSGPTTRPTIPTAAVPQTTATTSIGSTTSTTTTTTPTVELSGIVSDSDQTPMAGAVVSVGERTVTTGPDGRFLIAGLQPGSVTVIKPAWHPIAFEWDGSLSEVNVTIEPRVIRAIRYTRYNPDLNAVFELIDGTTVNAIVFDTKDETGKTLYDTTVELAIEMDAISTVYDPKSAVARAHDAGLYAITRVVTFEDPVWTRAVPAATLAGKWVDARNPDNWEYPLALATEACELGFDEIQFDYVRFPAGSTASAAPPTTQDERLNAIAAFLEEARSRLHTIGCAVSADIFGIVASSPTDEGIGQRPDELSAVTDALSPMIYPSHYSPGWLGYEDPNDHPGPVTANALDGALPRMASGSVLRPWLQAFYYSSAQIKTAIAEAEGRGLGWILWSASGSYSKNSLPSLDE